MCWPIASAAEYPKMREAPVFQDLMTPSSVFPTTASSDDSTMAASCARSTVARFWSVRS